MVNLIRDKKFKTQTMTMKKSILPLLPLLLASATFYTATATMIQPLKTSTDDGKVSVEFYGEAM